MHQYRITKYNPGDRDGNGAYLADDWTCAGDIGQTFQGKKLTAADYLRMEDSYVTAVLRFFNASGLPHLRVTCLDNKFADDNLAQIKATQHGLSDPAMADMVPHEDQQVGRNEIELICRMILRNIIWCKLEFAGQFFVHFGWDFYMYIGTVSDTSDAAEQIRADGLFVEEFTSPHGRLPGTIPVVVLEVCEADSGEHWGDIELAGVDIKTVRAAIGFSAEHPIDGSFTLDPSQLARLETLIAERLDANQFDYTLDTTG